jgi:hypothetical protein
MESDCVVLGTEACQITPTHRLQWHKHLRQVLRSIVRFRSESEDLNPVVA